MPQSVPYGYGNFMQNPHMANQMYGMPQMLSVQSVFQIESLSARMKDHNQSSGIYEDNKMSSENEKCFYQLIGKQILKMQGIIEKKLAIVEPLRQACFKRLFEMAMNTFEKKENQIDFKVFGSMETKLAIDTSDMDISLYGVID